MGFKRIVGSVVLVVGLLSGTPSAAQESGTLIFLDLPEGATVSIDNVPMALEQNPARGQSLTVLEGTVQVRVDARSGRSEATADVLAGAITTLNYREGRFDGGKMTVALLLPGSPQLTEGRPLVGGAVVLGLAGSVGGALWAGSQMSGSNARADAAALRYANARTEADAVAAREAHALAVEDSESARTTRLAFAAAGVAVYAVAALDAFLHHSRGAELDVSAPRRPIIAFRPSGAGVALQIRL